MLRGDEFVTFSGDFAARPSLIYGSSTTAAAEPWTGYDSATAPS